MPNATHSKERNMNQLTRRLTYKSTSSDSTYTALFNDRTGESSCNCMGWTRRVNKDTGERECVHTNPSSCTKKKLVLRKVEILDPAFTADGTLVRPASSEPGTVPAGWPVSHATAKSRTDRTVETEMARQWVPEDVSEAPAQTALFVTRKKIAGPAMGQEGSPVASLWEGFQPVSPMLASAPTKGQTADSFDQDAFILEQKYDGWRIVTEKRTVGGVIGYRSWGRPNRDTGEFIYRTLPTHLTDALDTMPDAIYDGEVIVPGGRCSDVASAWADPGRHEELVYVLFDVIAAMGISAADRPFTERRRMLEMATEHFFIFADCGPFTGPVRLSQQYPCKQSYVQAIWDAKGEGTIAKRATSTYREGHRTDAWVKQKLEKTTVMTIVGFKPGKGLWDSPVGITVCRGIGPKGVEIETPVKTKDYEEMRMLEKDPAAFIGRLLVISYTVAHNVEKFMHPMYDHLAGEGE
jgi:hypothetical protein